MTVALSHNQYLIEQQWLSEIGTPEIGFIWVLQRRAFRFAPAPH